MNRFTALAVLLLGCNSSESGGATNSGPSIGGNGGQHNGSSGGLAGSNNDGSPGTTAGGTAGDSSGAGGTLGAPAGGEASGGAGNGGDGDAGGTSNSPTLPPVECAAGDGFTWPEGYSAAVTLTYDDGLDSHIDVAVPVLESQGLVGTFFVSAQVNQDNLPRTPNPDAPLSKS